MQKIKTIFLLLFFMVCFLPFTACAYDSNYVLPYPSYMPGHKLYKIHQIWEEVQRYWYFGNLGRFKYHLKLADKYLVEAKTLFEYKQYLLAARALKKSNLHFQQAPFFLQRAEREGKEISLKIAILKAAADKHKETLKELLNKLPETIVWRPEKKELKKIEIKKLLQESTAIREKI